MNRWIIRCLLLGLFFASVTIRATSGNQDGAGVDINEAILHLMASRGFSYTGTTTIEDGALNSMAFDTPFCRRPLQIVPTDRTFEANALFDKIGASGDARIFAYLGVISRRADRRDMLFEHFKQRVLELIGMTPYQLDSKMVMISEPEGCDIASGIDWKLLWQRDYRSRAALDRTERGRQN
jgi:hypothetical protein